MTSCIERDVCGYEEKLSKHEGVAMKSKEATKAAKK